MAFANLSLLLGGLLIAIPVVLHLIMRPRPKHLVFPALRFIKQRRESNRRTLQLRQWMLLLLRCLAIGLLAATLARPSVSSAAVGNWLIIGGLVALLLIAILLSAFAAVQKRGKVLVGSLSATSLVLLIGLLAMLVSTLTGGSKVKIGDQEAPVAAALVIDTAPRMQYRHENRTRLEQVQETAHWLLRELPADSEVAVIDARAGAAVFAVDEGAAKKVIERLQTTGVPRPLSAVLEEALDLVRNSSKSRKEVYVFTDLTEAAWSGGSTASLRQRLDEAPDVLLYLIDVGVRDPQNFGLGQLQLSAQSLPRNSPLRVQTELVHVGSGGARSIELYVEEPDVRLPMIRDGKTLLPASQRRSQETCSFDSRGSQQVQFQLRGLELGVHQGYVRIVGEDGLAADDVRYFTVEVKDAWPVLVAAPQGVNTSLLTEAIAPYQYRQTGEARFDCDVIDQNDLANRSLNDYAAVCLVDPAPLTPPVWESLAKYAQRGGGVAIFLGHNASATASFNEPAAQLLLPGPLARQWRAGGRDLYVAPRTLDHPILAPFRPIASTVPWNQFPVFRHWDFDELSPDARVILPFGNNKPAIIERSMGKGRVLTMTTPVSDTARPAGRQPWNELPTGDNAWPYFVLANEIMSYLVESGEVKLNYQTGETAVLANHAGRDPERYQLFMPGDAVDEVRAGDGRVTVKFTELPGAYRLKGKLGDDGPVVSRGFCVNLSPQSTDLAPAPPGRLDELLGPDRYQLARNREEINREIGEARIGREFYPYLLTMMAVVLALEYLLSNRFYRKSF
jgi:hypothetical protein